ncbi:YobA family protein [Virgibacillus sp. DJP39]|uniref:YobA family protein n=1 Tax=Virgibacillus sp. DJP39 TaxID=3409790 RepID=UPI003BB67068
MLKTVLLILSFVMILVGCGNDDTNEYNGKPGITGYVMDKKEQRILVVSQEVKDFSESGGTKEFYDAVWANEAPNDVMVGEQVSVWFKGEVETSYPGQTSVGKLEVKTSYTPEDATLSDAEALNKALNQNEVGNEILTVQSISYDAKKDEWSISLKNTNNYKEYKIQIEEK